MKIFVIVLIVLCCSAQIVEMGRNIEVGNRNGFPIWIQTLTNNNGPPLTNEIVRLNAGERKSFSIRDEGWAGRIWPKTGCDQNGANCAFGQSVPPCPSGGCQPPADTKVEFFFPHINSPEVAFYDISLVDGFSLASEIIPYKDGRPLQQGSCIRTDCRLSINECPRNERNGLGDLTVKNRNGQAAACLAPCKRWNYPAPFGLGRNEQQGDGRQLCCPSPVSVGECRRGAVVQTEYVNVVRRVCPTAYSFSYDDLAGLHHCKNSKTTSFVVNFYS